MGKTANGILGCLAALLLIMIPIKAEAVDTPPNPLEKEGYTLDFADEFDGDSLDMFK